MYVCLCRGVTDKEIRFCKDHGDRTIKDLRERGITICDQCCKCNEQIREILSEEVCGGLSN